MVPRRLCEEGFEFRFPDLRTALAACSRRRNDVPREQIGTGIAVPHSGQTPVALPMGAWPPGRLFHHVGKSLQPLIALRFRLFSHFNRVSCFIPEELLQV